jgi:hypothetical protein
LAKFIKNRCTWTDIIILNRHFKLYFDLGELANCYSLENLMKVVQKFELAFFAHAQINAYL